MEILENIPLKDFTTFRIGGPARYFCRLTSADDVRAAAVFSHEKKLPLFILGGGSNILISDEGFPGLVAKMEIKGVEFHEEKGKVEVVAGAGENWDELVAETVSRGLYGLENLSLIPGSVGAAPVQNIGAYGAELSAVINWVEVFDRGNAEVKKFSREECQFGYRDSLFKKGESNLIITRVSMVLTTEGALNTDYRDVKEYFAGRHITQPKLNEVRKAVIEIRRRKLPNGSEVGTAGSFFKNPVISLDLFRIIRAEFPDAPSFSAGAGKVKVPLGWLIDHALHMKGHVRGRVGTHATQSLALVNLGGATAAAVQDFAEEIAQKIFSRFGIKVEWEVQKVS